MFLLHTLSFAADMENLGEPIQLKEQNEKVAFGFVYTLGNEDPDGNSVLLNFTRDGAALPKGTKWNIYRKDQNKFLFADWKVSPTETSVWSTQLDENSSVRDVLPFQEQTVFVFETPQGTRMQLDIGKMCADKKFATYFKNMTNKKAYNEITEKDLGPKPKKRRNGNPRGASQPGHSS